jgi:hypothetical protein
MANKFTFKGAEEQVLNSIRDRLAMGAVQYGDLDVYGDPREWKQEATFELADWWVYFTCEAMRGHWNLTLKLAAMTTERDTLANEIRRQNAEIASLTARLAHHDEAMKPGGGT